MLSYFARNLEFFKYVSSGARCVRVIFWASIFQRSEVECSAYSRSVELTFKHIENGEINKRVNSVWAFGSYHYFGLILLTLSLLGRVV